MIWSGGGALIGPNDNVRGVLASPQNVRSLSDWQALFSLGYAQSVPVDPDPFGSGRSAMDRSGHWMLRSHLARKGNDLGVAAPPRAGPSRKQRREAAGAGALSARTEQPRLAAEWLRWVTSTTGGVVPIVHANGAVPSRRSAFEVFPEYERLPRLLFRQQLERSARPRPRTPFALCRHESCDARASDQLRDLEYDRPLLSRQRRTLTDAVCSAVA